MKTISKIMMLITVLVLVACNSNGERDSPEPVEESGTIEFLFDVKDNTGNDGGRKGTAGRIENAVADKIVVTIQTTTGEVVHDLLHLDVVNVGGSIISVPISLEVGDYQLTEYFVEDADGNAIYASPLEGSELAYLVDDPLPIEFSISADGSDQLTPEVLSTADVIAGEFGYSDFSFEITETFDFLMSVQIFDLSSNSYVLTDANVQILGDGTEIYNQTIADITDQIRVNDGYADYTIITSKSGYENSEVVKSNSELKAHLSSPLLIVMVPQVEVPSTNFVNSGQSFSIDRSTSVRSDDLDGDGDLDLFLSRTNGLETEVLVNDGVGNFSLHQSLGVLNVTDAALGDLDNDGDMDVIMSQWTEQPNLVYFNDGSGNFSNSGQSLGAAASYKVKLGDLDNDGDLDAVVVDIHSLPILLNDGTGTFTEVAQLSGGIEALDVALGDLDGDGFMDIYVTNGAVTGMSDLVFINDGNASFTNSGQTLGNARSVRVELADLDGDNDLDAFTGGHLVPSEVWLNNGSGSFTNSGLSIGNSDVAGINLVDFDLDGDIDAFTVSDNNGPQTLWLNDGNGSFTDSAIIFGNFSSNGAAHGDFDGDGDLDIYVTNYNVSDILWLGTQD